MCDPRRLIAMIFNVYNFDVAIYDGNSARDFYRFCRKNNKNLTKFLPGQLVYSLLHKLRIIPKTKWQEKYFAFLADIEDVDAQVRLFWQTHESKIKTWFPDYRRNDDVLVSVSPEFLLEAVAEKLNFTLIATKMDKKTGKISGKTCFGKEKLERFEEKFSGADIGAVFSATTADRPLVRSAQRAYWVHKNRAYGWTAYDKRYAKTVKLPKGLNYKRVCVLETADFYRRFLPYSVGTPAKEPTYITPYCDQYQRVNLVCFADSHIVNTKNSRSVDNVKRTVRFANESPVKFDAVIHAGDIITPTNITPNKVAYQNAKKFFDLAKKSKSPFIFAKGNHDLNDWNNLPENVLTDKDWGNLFLNYAEKTYGIKRQTRKNGEKSTWHYYDINKKKIRIISLDMMDTDKTAVNENGRCRYYGGKSWYISDEQMNWVVKEALNFDDKREKDWGIVITMHMYPKNIGIHANAADVLLDICAAFNAQETYSYHYRHEENSFFDMDIEADFTRYAQDEKKPTVICWLLGHDHERKHFIQKGIPIIYIIHGCGTSISSDPRLVRIPGTCTQNAFDVVNIDTLHRKIRVFGYGANMTCYGESGDRFLPDGLSY